MLESHPSPTLLSLPMQALLLSDVTSGDSSDWAKGRAGIKFAFGVELRPGQCYIKSFHFNIPQLLLSHSSPGQAPVPAAGGGGAGDGGGDAGGLPRRRRRRRPARRQRHPGPALASFRPPTRASKAYPTASLGYEQALWSTSRSVMTLCSQCDLTLLNLSSISGLRFLAILRCSIVVR